VSALKQRKTEMKDVKEISRSREVNGTETECARYVLEQVASGTERVLVYVVRTFADARTIRRVAQFCTL